MAVRLYSTATVSARSTVTVLAEDLSSSSATFKATAGSVMAAILDNTQNPTEAAYLKAYASAAPTVGTTAPELVLRARKGCKLMVAFSSGAALATAVTAACVTAGGTGGTTAPTGQVDARLCVN